MDSQNLALNLENLSFLLAEKRMAVELKIAISQNFNLSIFQ